MQTWVFPLSAWEGGDLGADGKHSTAVGSMAPVELGSYPISAVYSAQDVGADSLSLK